MANRNRKRSASRRPTNFQRRQADKPVESLDDVGDEGTTGLWSTGDLPQTGHEDALDDGQQQFRAASILMRVANALEKTDRITARRLRALADEASPGIRQTNENNPELFSTAPHEEPMQDGSAKDDGNQEGALQFYGTYPAKSGSAGPEPRSARRKAGSGKKDPRSAKRRVAQSNAHLESAQEGSDVDFHTPQDKLYGRVMYIESNDNEVIITIDTDEGERWEVVGTGPEGEETWGLATKVGNAENRQSSRSSRKSPRSARRRRAAADSYPPLQKARDHDLGKNDFDSYRVGRGVDFYTDTGDKLDGQVVESGSGGRGRVVVEVTYDGGPSDKGLWEFEWPNPATKVEDRSEEETLPLREGPYGSGHKKSSRSASTRIKPPNKDKNTRIRTASRQELPVWDTIKKALKSRVTAGGRWGKGGWESRTEDFGKSLSLNIDTHAADGTPLVASTVTFNFLGEDKKRRVARIEVADNALHHEVGEIEVSARNASNLAEHWAKQAELVGKSYLED